MIAMVYNEDVIRNGEIATCHGGYTLSSQELKISHLPQTNETPSLVQCASACPDHRPHLHKFGWGPRSCHGTTVN